MNSEVFMLNLIELKQFVAFADYGTLSEVSQRMNISQPTLTRNMKHVERDFGVSLFTRQKNKMFLNETGEIAVEYARQLLKNERNVVQMVQEFDRKLRSITIASCAPAPLWLLSPKISFYYPDNTITSSICETEQVIEQLNKEQIDIGILPYEYKTDNLYATPFFTEHLSVCVPLGHNLCSYDKLAFHDLNGYNCLLRDQLGFWTNLCKREMPASKFLIQTDESEFLELVKSSTLFCFSTNYASYPEEILNNRKRIPIVDDCANVIYYLVWRKGKEYKF